MATKHPPDIAFPLPPRAYWKPTSEGFPVNYNHPAEAMARVIAEFDDIVNQWSGRADPPEVWRRLREVRAGAFLAFERWAGKGVRQVLDGAELPER
jgi:hypothetical protein